MTDDPLAARLDRIELRLRRLESQTGLATDSPPPVRPTSAMPPPAAKPLAPPAPASSPEPGLQAAAPSPTSPSATPRPAPTPPILHPPLSYASPPPPPQPAPSLKHLEHQIGLKWAGWVGAIVLVIGTALGIDFAYEHGWFALVSPLVRMAILCAAAAALLAAGEWVYRRVSALSAAGLFGAGVATLLLTCYAGHAYYGLYGPGAVWALMFAATLIGAAVARRGNLVSIGVVSLVGGYLTPALVRVGSIPAASFCAYLLALEMIALLLAGWGSGTEQPTKWWTLRGLALAGTAIWIASQFTSGQIVDSWVMTPFLLIAAVGFQAELIVAGRRPGRADARIGINFSMLVTAALAAALLIQFRQGPPWVCTAWILGLSAAAGAAALLLFRRSAAALRHLSLSYTVQCGALLVVAVPVALSGAWISVGWAVLSLAFAVVVRAVDLQTARRGAVTCWLLAVANLVLWTSGLPLPFAFHRAHFVGITILGVSFPGYALVGFALAVVGHAVGVLIEQPSDGAAAAPPPLALLADVLWALAALIALPAAAATAMLAVGAGLLLAPAALGDEQRRVRQAVAMLALASAKWLAFDTLFLRVVMWTLSRSAFVDSTTLTGLLLVIAWMVMLATPLRKHLGRQGSLAGAGCCVLLLLWEGSLGVDRFFGVAGGLFADPALAEQVGLSIFWSVFAIVAIGVGFALRHAPLRYFGLGLFALTLAKVLLIDLSQVSTGYRVLSFIGLGLLLLGTSVLYGKLSPLLLSEREG